jgi:hypothetical protein
LGTVFIDIGVLRNKKFQRNRFPAKYFSRQLGEQQSKLYSPDKNLVALGDWVTVTFFSCKHVMVCL